jgi:hypothetical protein
VAINEGVDKLFYCWARISSGKPGVAEEFISCKASDFWLITGEERSYTDFVSKYYKPRGYITVSLRSRRLYRYGVFELRTKLPRWDNGPILWFGFESDDLFGGGCIHFSWFSGSGVLKANAGGFVSRVEMDVTRYLPNDPSENYNIFRIIHRRNMALYYINDKLRAVALLAEGDTRDSKIVYDKDPYIIGLTRDRPSARLGVLLDIDAGDIERSYEWRDLHPWGLRVSETDPDAPITLDLYREGVKDPLRNTEVESSILTAPFPGLVNKARIYLVATGSGRVVVQEYIDGDWSDYDSISFSGDKILRISISEPGIMHRLLIEPETKIFVKKGYVLLK